MIPAPTGPEPSTDQRAVVVAKPKVNASTDGRAQLLAARVLVDHLLWICVIVPVCALVAAFGLVGSVERLSLLRWLAFVFGGTVVAAPALFRMRNDLAVERKASYAMRPTIVLFAGALLGSVYGAAALLRPSDNARPHVSIFVIGFLMTVLMVVTVLTVTDQMAFWAIVVPIVLWSLFRELTDRPSVRVFFGSACFVLVMGLVHRISSRLHGDLFTARAKEESRYDALTRRTAAAEQTNELLRRTNAEITELARLDDLTGVANRRAFLETLRTDATRATGQFSFAILDIDHFKAVNDTYGHLAGDIVLRAVVEVISSRLVSSLPTAVLGRLGGEEFGVLLPGLAETEATELLDRVRLDVCSNVTIPETDFPVALSVGVVEGRARIAIPTLLGSADRALYRAKNDGRNRVCRASDNPVETYPVLVTPRQ